MANETTSSTLEEAINSEWIDPAFQDYASDFTNAQRFCYERDLTGQKTNTWAVPRLVSDMGTVGTSAGVDTEFDATEATDLSNTALETTESTVSASEYGLMRTITDQAMEDIIDGLALMQLVVQDAARILMTAFEDDVIAQFASFTNTSGATGVDITIANFKDAYASIRNRGVRAAGGLVAVLADNQVTELEAALEASGTSQAVYPGTADGMLRARPSPDNGLNDGLVFSLYGVPVYQTGLDDTANTGADVVGGVWVRGDVPANRPHTALGINVKRRFRAEQERDASLRATEVVTTMRKGVGILRNDAGQGVVTDAP